jgi:hypothetical protein
MDSSERIQRRRATGEAGPMCADDVLEERDYAQGRVEARGRILRDMRRESTPNTSCRIFVLEVDLFTRDGHDAARDPHARPGVPEDPERCGGFARARLSDDPDGFARSEAQIDVLHDRLPGTQLDTEI